MTDVTQGKRNTDVTPHSGSVSTRTYKRRMHTNKSYPIVPSDRCYVEDDLELRVTSREKHVPLEIRSKRKMTPVRKNRVTILKHYNHFRFDSGTALGKQILTIFGPKIVSRAQEQGSFPSQEAFLKVLLKDLNWKIYYLPSEEMLYLGNDVDSTYMKQRFGNVTQTTAFDVYEKAKDLDILESLIERGVSAL